MTLILGYKSRGCTKDLTILDADSESITPGMHDKVRVMIGREGQTPELTITSDAATANGSSITKGDPCRLRIDASDLSFPAGAYSFIFDYFDNADAQEWKNISRQVFVLEDT